MRKKPDTYTRLKSTNKRVPTPQINLLDDRVAIYPDTSPEKSEGGIFIPVDAREKQQRGSVVAKGPGKLNDLGERIPLSVEVGDTVIFSLYGGVDMEIDREEYKIVRESDILAIYDSVP